MNILEQFKELWLIFAGAAGAFLVAIQRFLVLEGRVRRFEDRMKDLEDQHHEDAKQRRSDRENDRALANSRHQETIDAIAELRKYIMGSSR